MFSVSSFVKFVVSLNEHLVDLAQRDLCLLIVSFTCLLALMLHHEDRAEPDRALDHILHALVRHNELLYVRLYRVVKHSGLKIFVPKAQEHTQDDQLVNVDFDLTKSALAFTLCLPLAHLVQEHIVSDQLSHGGAIGVFIIILATISHVLSRYLYKGHVLLKEGPVFECES